MVRSQPVNGRISSLDLVDSKVKGTPCALLPVILNILPCSGARARASARRHSPRRVAVDKPQRVARSEPPVWEKILAAVGTTIAVNVTKKIVERTWNQTVQSGRTA